MTMDPGARRRAAADGVGTRSAAGWPISPEFRPGLPVTLLLALVATAGRVLVPIAVQQTSTGACWDRAAPTRAGCAPPCCSPPSPSCSPPGAPTGSTCGSSGPPRAAWPRLRVRAFRHVHDLSVLTQNAERRGSLVSRVTSDVDTISQFMQWGGC